MQGIIWSAGDNAMLPWYFAAMALGALVAIVWTMARGRRAERARLATTDRPEPTDPQASPHTREE